MTGAITGRGDKSHSQFRPESQYVKPVMLIRVKEEGAKLEIRSLTIEEII